MVPLAADADLEALLDRVRARPRAGTAAVTDPIEVTVRDARADGLAGDPAHLQPRDPRGRRDLGRLALERRAAARHGSSSSATSSCSSPSGRTRWRGSPTQSPYRAKFGYRFTREVTFYVDPAFHRRGVGRLLLAALIERARARNLHSLVAWIEADNEASRALVRSFGFEEVGREREAGYKHGRWLDGIDAQLLLQSAEEFERLVAPGFRILTIETAEQLAEAIEVRRAVFIEEQDVPEDEEIDDYDADPAAPGMSERVVHVLGRLDGRPVATARLLLDHAGEPPHGYPHVGRVAVLSALRGRHYRRAGHGGAARGGAAAWPPRHHARGAGARAAVLRAPRLLCARRIVPGRRH